ncbi:MAG: hypothetical protein U1E60_09075 [Reyranellaceae bacterium]
MSGNGLMLGLLGNGAVYPPLLVYVSRWSTAAAARRSRSSRPGSISPALPGCPCSSERHRTTGWYG